MFTVLHRHSFLQDPHLPVNRDFRRKQSHYKTGQSMKIDQSVKLFGQIPRLVMHDELYL